MASKPLESSAPGRIFISYRRDDTAYPAGWLFDRLRDRVGGRVFKDVDSIELGDDFVDRITAAVASCDVLLVLIGDRWLTIDDAGGRRRIDDPDDFVRLEIQAALKREIRVIPVLVGGAKMPRPDELPAALAGLARRQALELNPGRFDFDMSRLEQALAAPSAEPTRRARWLNRRALLTLSAVMVTVVVAIAALVVPGDKEGAPGSRGGAAASSGGATAAPTDIPATIKSSCYRLPEDEAWMVGDDSWGASAQWKCKVNGVDLNYAVYTSAEQAASALPDVFAYTLRTDSTECDQAARGRIDDAKGRWNGTARCGVSVADESAGDVSVYWNDQGSRLVGRVTSGSEIKPRDAVDQWANRFISSD